MSAQRRVSVVLFDGFELLDVFGPVELFFLSDRVQVDYLGLDAGPVASSQGGQVVAERALSDLSDPDIVLVPGGRGTRALVHDQAFLAELARLGDAAALTTSVCTGAALLAVAGLLDGYHATSNKASFDWVCSLRSSVNWEPQARWVHDRDRWTSSGVAAGMDMAAALLAELFGPQTARRATERGEYQPHTDASLDPFARIHGLVAGQNDHG